MNKKIYFILLLTIIFYCLDYYFRISPGLIVKQLIVQYHTTAFGIGSFVSAFYFGYLIFQIPSGYLLDIWPLKRTLILSISICTLAFIAFISLSNYPVGLLLRWIVGAASAFSFVSVLFIARNYLPAHYFSLIASITIAAGTLIASVAQSASSALLMHFNWHVIFIGFACVGIVIAIIISVTKIDHIQQRSSQFQSLTLRLLWQQVKQLLSQPAFTINGIVGGLFYLPTSILAAAWGITFLNATYNLDHTAASNGIVLLFAGWAIGSPIIGGLADHIKYPKILVSISSACACIVSIALLYLPQFFSHSIWVYILMFLFGLFSSAQVIVWKIFSRICPINISGVGVALTNMIIMLGGALFHAIVGWFIERHSNSALALQSSNLLKGLWIIPTVFFLSTILSLLIKDGTRNTAVKG